jgi:N6-adenosine-specific RNA methylase IME4
MQTETTAIIEADQALPPVIIDNSDWYEHLVEDCKAIITEAVFNSRWALVEGYHQLGERIVTDENYQWHAKGNMSYLQGLANNLEISNRTIYYAVQFYEKYPDLSLVPEGKNISWNKIVTKYLPSPTSSNTPDLPDGKYRIIYADPPWQYRNSMPEFYDNVHFGTQDEHYFTMSLEDICALPIKDMAEDNAVLFLWVTSPILEDAFEVIKAWGFEYKSSFVWDKVKHVMGHFNSVRHELLLICTRGSCQPDIHKLFDSVITEERTDHSTKPEIFREIIDTIYPHGRRIELFARRQAEGWEVYGNEVIS